MANNNNLKTIIQAVINANSKQAITGDIMQQTLVAIVDALGKGYQFMGIATPATDPGTTDQKVFYIANGKGVYTNFGGLNVGEDGLVLLVYSETWTKLLVTNLADLADGSVTTPKIADKAVQNSKISDGAVDTTKLADNSVTTPKISDGAVTTKKLQQWVIRQNDSTADIALWNEIKAFNPLTSKIPNIVFIRDNGFILPVQRIFTIAAGEMYELHFFSFSPNEIIEENPDDIYFNSIVVLIANYGEVSLYVSSESRPFSYIMNIKENWLGGTVLTEESIDASKLQNGSVTKSKLESAIQDLLDGIKYFHTLVPFTDTTLSNKAQLEVFLSKVPDATVMHCTYKEIWAGTLHKINGDWYGLLVKNTNNPADNINIKLSADGTITEGNVVQ